MAASAVGLSCANCSADSGGGGGSADSMGGTCTGTCAGGGAGVLSPAMGAMGATARGDL